LRAIATAEADIVVRVRRRIIQIRIERPRIRAIAPIAATFHRAVDDNPTHSYEGI